MTNSEFITMYAKATSSERVDMIMRRYPEFLDLVEGCTDGLLYIIETEKDYIWQKEKGELGVRVQTGTGPSDPTATLAIRRIMTKAALIDCDFSGGVLDSVVCGEELKRKACILREMRQDYALFKSLLVVLGPNRQLFEQYLRKEKTLTEIAEEQHILYESAQQKMNRMRSKMRLQVTVFMEGRL